VDEDLAHRELVSGGLALGPQRVPRAAEERHVARTPRDVPCLLVHEADHQHFAAHVVLHDRGYQSIELREIHKWPVYRNALTAFLRTTKNPATFPAGSALGFGFRVPGS